MHVYPDLADVITILSAALPKIASSNPAGDIYFHLNFRFLPIPLTCADPGIFVKVGGGGGSNLPKKKLTANKKNQDKKGKGLQYIFCFSMVQIHFGH